MNIQNHLTSITKHWADKTPAEALRAALVLAITAPDDNKAEDALNLARYFARFVSDETVEKIKREIEQDMSKGTADNAA
jgi:enoyl-CoA hydratase/carnithine racemase